MAKWRGINWGRDFSRRITKEQFKIHSVFRNVINLQSEKDPVLLSFTIRPQAIGPNACLLEGPEFAGNFHQGDTLEVHSSLIQCGESEIDCIKVKDLKTTDWTYNSNNSKEKMVWDWLERQAPGMARTRNHLTEQLSVSLQQGDGALLHTALTGFIGHGEGLTPSGDDFIAGVLIAFVQGFHLVQEHNKFITQLPSIIKDLWWRTNFISQTMLWYAAHGEGAAYVADVVGSIYSDSGGALEMASRLWHVGATSGRYLLSGILLGCEIFRTREQNEHGRKDLN